ncbi:MAG TPA: DEAD/DEAH box helicase [Methanolinea sp.]|nr:DEAD/DEAH box helicase [Methanolinea sp.]
MDQRMDSEVFFGLHEALQDVLSHRLGWSHLREVQARTYRAVRTGKDVLAIAPTAGGKTEAALIPVIDAILKEGRSGVACLYISPLKALINDQEERFLSFCIPTGLDLKVWHGDVPRGDRSWDDGEPPHVLMITPESLEVLMGEKALARDLARTRFVIVDELHSFVESERGVHLRILLDRLNALAGSPVQRIGLSATVGNPAEVLAWFSGPRRGGEVVEVLQPPREKKFSFSVQADPKRRTQVVAGLVAGKKALVFVNSRAEAEELGSALRGTVRHLFVHHSSLSPQMRRAAEESLEGSESACIICTSTLELGIDIGDLDIVVQVGAPASVSSFLQRMGRSGRRGGSPYMAFVLPDAWALLVSTAVIESARKKRVEPLIPKRKPYNVLVQQVFLAVLRHRRTTAARIEKETGALPGFCDLPAGAVRELIAFLEREGFLVRDGEFLMSGPRMESLYGRSQGKDLYSVIQGGGEVRAVTPDGEQIGRLDARFVAGRGREGFSLGGRDWTLVGRDDQHGLVVVVPGGETGGRAFWTGGQQAGLSPEVCRSVQRILGRGRTLLPLGPREEEEIASCIASFPPLHSRGIHVWETGQGKKRDVVALTFLSRGRNALLALLARSVLGERTKVRYDDISLLFPRVGGPGSADRVLEAFRKIQEMSVSGIEAAIPVPHPSAWKFGAALPPAFLHEMAASDTWQVQEFAEEFGSLPLYRVQAPGEPAGPGS